MKKTKLDKVTALNLGKAAKLTPHLQAYFAVAGFYNMSNRIAAATDMRPNRDYHYMARDRVVENAR